MRVLLTALLLIPALSSAGGTQSPAKDSVYATVTRLFDGMRTRDTTLMRTSFVPHASMQLLTKDGVKFDSIDSWINSVARARPGLVLDERLANPVVQVDGDLASIWVDYWFFAGDRLSHCGVDAMHLYRHDGVWRIFSIVDTRRTEGCAAAPLTQNIP